MKVGFIGAGNMAGAIINGLVKTGQFDKKDINIHDKADTATAGYAGFNVLGSNVDVVLNSDYVILAVKPNKMEEILNEINDSITADTVIISIAAGWPTEKIQKYLPEDTKLVRIMPNTPALVGKGMSVISADHTLNEDEISFVKSLFYTIGIVETIDPHLMDAVTGLSGSGPAYVYMFIQAMADAGVLQGLPRATALKLAAQTVLGSAEMVIKTGKHPIALCDDVCSPGGTTITAVHKLHENGLTAAVMNAVKACTEKSKELSGKDD